MLAPSAQPGPSLHTGKEGWGLRSHPRQAGLVGVGGETVPPPPAALRRVPYRRDDGEGEAQRATSGGALR